MKSLRSRPLLVLAGLGFALAGALRTAAAAAAGTLCTLFLVAASPALGSEPSGIVSGTVRNDTTDAFLLGAEVSVIGTSLRTLTARDGSFVLPRVPAGPQTLRVFYTDLRPAQLAVVVSDAARAVVEVRLASDVLKLEAFTVTGEREGNAASLTRQRFAPNVRNVVSIESFGNVVDGNVGEFLKRLPGIHAIQEEGEILAIGIRGMPPTQTGVMLDGTPLPAALAGSQQSAAGDRAAPIDRVPAEFIKEVELNKGAMPDIPVSGLGGNVNLVTKSAFDFKSRVVTYNTGTVHNTYRDGNKWYPVGTITYLDTFLDRSLAVSLSGSYAESNSARDQVQVERFRPDSAVTLARLLDDTFETTRYGGSAKLEYKLTPDTTLGASVMYSRYSRDTVRKAYRTNDRGARRDVDYNVVSRAAILAGTAPRSTGNLVATVAPGFDRNATELLGQGWTSQAMTEPRRGHNYKYGVTFSTTIAGYQISGQASYLPGRFTNKTYEFNTVLIASRNIGLRIDATDREFPVFTQTYGPDVTSAAPANLALYNLNNNNFNGVTDDRIKTGQVDVKRRFELARPFTLKAGLMWTGQDRYAYTYSNTWQYRGRDGVQGLNNATGVNDDNLAQFVLPRSNYRMFNGRYPAYFELDLPGLEAALQRSLAARDNHFFPTNNPVVLPRTVEEEVKAAYTMGTWELGRLQLVGGVRFEQTEVSATGSLSDPLAPTTPTTTVNRDYRQAFPSAHARFEATPNLLLRASWSSTMARPAISQLVPDTSVNHTTLLVSRNNPGLKPYYAENIDLTAEYYFRPSGLLSAGFFHKDISDYIYNTTETIGSGAGNGFNGNYAGYELRTQRNAGKARVRGLELNYTQRLTFLPGVLNGLSAFANYTRLQSRGTFDGGASQLPAFVPRMHNLGLSYQWRRMLIRTAAKYTHDNVRAINVDPLQTQWNTGFWSVDAGTEYSFRPWLRFYADIVNLGNRWADTYNGNTPDRLFIHATYGPKLSLGFSGRF